MNPFYKKTLIAILSVITTLLIVSCMASHVDPKINESSLCEQYEMQMILQSDSTAERIKKLQENTYFQKVCND